MNITGFTQEQKQALFDLLVVGMYADHSLASAEDDRIQKVLDSFEFQSDYERQNFSDAAFTRASRQAGSPEAIRAYVTQVAGHFPAREIRRKAYDILDDLLTSDGRVTSEESQLLSAAREVFQLSREGLVPSQLTWFGQHEFHYRPQSSIAKAYWVDQPGKTTSLTEPERIGRIEPHQPIRSMPPAEA